MPALLMRMPTRPGTSVAFLDDPERVLLDGNVALVGDSDAAKGYDLVYSGLSTRYIPRLALASTAVVVSSRLRATSG